MLCTRGPYLEDTTTGGDGVRMSDAQSGLQAVESTQTSAGDTNPIACVS